MKLTGHQLAERVLAARRLFRSNDGLHKKALEARRDAGMLSVSYSANGKRFETRIVVF